MPKGSICCRQSEVGSTPLTTQIDSYWLLNTTQSLLTLRPEWLLTPISCMSVVTACPAPGLDPVQSQTCDQQRRRADM